MAKLGTSPSFGDGKLTNKLEKDQLTITPCTEFEHGFPLNSMITEDGSFPGGSDLCCCRNFLTNPSNGIILMA
jgi:hypothetical protein